MCVLESQTIEQRSGFVVYQTEANTNIRGLKRGRSLPSNSLNNANDKAAKSDRPSLNERYILVPDTITA